MESVVTFLQDVVPQVSISLVSEIPRLTLGQGSSEIFCSLSLISVLST